MFARFAPFVLLFASGGAALCGSAKPAEPLQSNYRVGERVLPLLSEYRVTGPRAGHTGSLTCTYMYQPVVVVYTREITPPLIRLVKKLDEATAKYATRPLPPYKERLGSYLVLVCDSKEREKELKAFAEKEKIEATTVALVVAGEGAFQNKLGDAETTVLLAEPRAVIKASYAFRKGELADKDAERVLANLPKILPKKPGPGDEAKVRRDTVKGGLYHSSDDWTRITGKVTVKNGYTIVFENGKEVELGTGPELEQMGKIGDDWYPAGREAAEFLRKLIGDQTVTMYVNANSAEYERGEVTTGRCFIGETNLGSELIRNGWAIAGHSSVVATEIMARENKRGLWRGQFVPPDEWRQGKRLPGEEAARAKLNPATVQPAAAGDRPKVERTVVHGQWRFPNDTFLRIHGRVRVLDAHTLLYEDGTEVDLNGAADVPDLGQKGRIGDRLYPAGEQAAEFLRKLIGERPVTSYTGDADEGNPRKFRKVHAFLDETCLNDELMRSGWAMAHHTGMAAWEAIAREKKRGIWRGEFVLPEKWRKGERLPGEAPTPKDEEKKPADNPAAIVGTWEITAFHATQASLFQLGHGVRKRAATVRFEKVGDRIIGHAVSTEHDGPSDPIVFRTLRFTDDRLVFEFDIKGWRPGAGPIAVEDRRLPNKGMLRAEARLTGGRLVGSWALFTADGTEVYRGEWEAVRANAKK